MVEIKKCLTFWKQNVTMAKIPNGKCCIVIKNSASAMKNWSHLVMALAD